MLQQRLYEGAGGQENNDEEERVSQVMRDVKMNGRDAAASFLRRRSRCGYADVC
jgi:hypothetical protein